MCAMYGLSSTPSCKTTSIANWRNSFSTVARPLTDLLRGMAKRLRWGPKAEKAFSALKEAFSTAPVLQQPDLEVAFVVEDHMSSSWLLFVKEMVGRLLELVRWKVEKIIVPQGLCAASGAQCQCRGR
ncbi:hypothetical protein P4O66_001131 [Electrophorus voltai]|uniref:Reverse transcriptase/retrotransposon-derived protein RNase H-like domain-containing protein n=1 Tax=Electrophorus voltai TaxID=2609070 RepID=A0AAD8ZCQ6_9TELE|nr:hypothetical protein P4O66_001131 [Electrophorus voltai]